MEDKLATVSSPEPIGIERLNARLGVILGVIGTTDKGDAEPDETKEARRLANEALQSAPQLSKRSIRLGQASAVNAKLTASEALILDRLPINYLTSSLRDNCMEIMGLVEGANGEHLTREKQFITDTLKELNSAKGQTDGAARGLYLQVRQRLDTIVASRMAVIDATHRFMSTLWLRTVSAVLVCSIPVVIFLYKRYSHKNEPLAQPTQPTSSATASPFDIDAAQKALVTISDLRAYLEKLPTVAVKPKLDLKDIRSFSETNINAEGRFDQLVNLIANLGADAPAQVLQLGKRLVEIKGQSSQEPQQTLGVILELRNQEQQLVDLEAYLSGKIRQINETPASPHPFTEEGITRGSDDPSARLATLFSVIIMGMVGAFVSNYSRVCALLKDAAPLGVSSADRSIRVRFSPFLGGLLAVALSEVFGGHLIQGDLFPMTESMHRWTDLIWSGQAYSKLLVWGFIAGMSEDYVLRILGNLVGKVNFGDKSERSAQA